MKKKIIIFLLVLFILLSIYMLYNTFAINTYITSNNDTYTITLTEDNNTVTVPSNSSKTVYYHIKNTNKGKVRYGVGYNTSSNIEVLIYEDSKDKAEDIISYGENKYIKLYLKNTSDTDSTVTISTILGYENGGDLIVPTTSTLVAKTYKKPVSLAKYITNLYTNASKSTVTNNSITYNYATDVSLMNDRLGGTTTDLDGGNIRYYGASPNNYIYFNCSDYSNQTSSTCELWRIIGVFDGKVKIMRNSIIGTYSWDTSESTVNSGYGVNEWSQADLMKLLNPGYETESVGGSLYYNSGSGTCYSGQSNTTKSCDFTSTGIKNSATKEKIADVTYYTGGWNSNGIYSNDMYEKERGTKVVTNPSDGITRTTKWPGKIAVPYPSDYGYAADLSLCQKRLQEYSDSTCTSNNWMNLSIHYLQNNAWLLTPYSSYANRAWLLGWTGYIGGDVIYIYYARAVVPVLYLNSDQKIVDGDGSSNSPYQLLGN